MRISNLSLASLLSSLVVVTACGTCSPPTVQGEGEGEQTAEGEGEGGLPIGEGEGSPGEGEGSSGEGEGSSGEGEGASSGEGEGASSGEGEGEGASGEGEGEGAAGGCARDIECAVDELCEQSACVVDTANHGVDIAIDEVRFGPVHAVEIVSNLGLQPIDLHGFTLKRDDGTSATIRAASDPTGSQGTAVSFSATPVFGAFGVVETNAAFVVGDAGTSFRLPDVGALALYDATGARVDVVTFDATLPVDDTGAHTSELDVDEFTTFAGDPRTVNDAGTAWCVDQDNAGTLGAQNRGCAGAIVVNEVLYNYKNLADDDDSGREFIELHGPAGASLERVIVKGAASDIAFAGSGRRMNDSGFLVIADNGNAVHTVPNTDLLAPLSLDDNAGTISVCISATRCVDSITWGPGGFNAIQPNSMSISLTRDFRHFDPTPTPGAANDDIVPTIVSLAPDNGLASTTTDTVATTKDIADVASDPAIHAAFGAQRVDCQVTSLLDEGRAGALVACTVPANGAAARTVVELGNQNPFALPNASLVNGWTWTGVVNSVGFCNVQFPQGTTTASAGNGVTFFSQVFQSGVTDQAGFDPSILDEIGVGTFGSDPTTSSNAYTWSATEQSAADTGFQGHNDEYKAVVNEPQPGVFGVLFRVSVDGGLNFTYCDSDDTENYDPSKATQLTVN